MENEKSIEERVSALKEKIIKKRGCKLYPTIALAEVERLEETYHFKLPEEYRVFITQAGNGGILPPISEECRELQPFQEKGETWVRMDHLQNTFSLEESWVWEYDLDYVSDEDEVRWDMAHWDNGHVTLMESDVEGNETWLLIVTGPRAGEVWWRTEFGIKRLKDCSFLDWLELHLSKKLQKYVEKCSKKDLEAQQALEALWPQEPLDLIRILMKRRGNKRTEWNPPITMEEVRAFEQKHGIELPEEYVRFITEIADGGNHLLTGTYSSMYRLKDLDCLEGLSKPFQFQSTTPRDLPNYRDFSLGKGSIWNKWSEYFPDSQISADTSEVWAKIEYSVLNGALPIITYNDSERQIILILNGTHRGEIWHLSRKYIRCSTEKYYGFFDWMIDLLKQQL